MHVYSYKGVTASEPPNGVICVEDREGHIVALTTSIPHAVARFMQALPPKITLSAKLEESEMSEQETA
jgi:hypothetical protein